MRQDNLTWPEDDVEAQAAYWMTVLNSDSVSGVDRKAFRHWLESSQAHQDAYGELLYTWQDCDGLATDPELLNLRRESLTPTTAEKPWRKYAAIAATLLVGIFIARFSIGELIGPNDQNSPTDVVFETASIEPTYLSTAIGERSTMNLEDGSTVELNTDTKVRVAFTEHERRLYLLNGQALFSVAHNPERPFVVYAGGRRITALGTEFEVKFQDEDVAVTLITGLVKVDELQVADDVVEPIVKRSVELKQGQRLAGQSVVPEAIDSEKLVRSLGWREGRLEFLEEDLADIVAEINRYSTRKVVLGDSRLSKIPYGGTFKAGNVDSLAIALLVDENALSEDEILSEYKFAREDDVENQKIIIRLEKKG